MNVHISKSTEEVIAAALSTGEYSSAEEFIEAMAKRWKIRYLATRANSDGQTAYDALKRQGLIGCMLPGPTDLATNPSHMDGFGR